jgi:integral membrane sensor domain MASE1
MGAIDALCSPLWRQTSPGTEFLQWIASDALGACVATPACVAIFRTRFRKSLYSLSHWAHLVPIIICAVVAFSQGRLPVPFLLYPLLVLVLLRLNLGWAALASLLVAAIGSSLTVHGHGPFAVSASTTQLASAILLQLFIASAMVTLYSVSVVIESLRNTERRLHEIAARHKLVTENSRDVIILADLKGNRSYCSSAVKIFGYTEDEVTKTSSLDLVHPEDLGIAASANGVASMPG